jgi:thioredoxin reductase
MGFMPSPPPETPKFKEWFKDSKVVDSRGRPKIVLHGTASDFYAFKNDRLGAATKQVDTPLGFFFTEDPEGANYFAESAGKARAGLDRRDAYNGGSGVIPQGAAIVPAVLSIQKPYVFKTPNEFSQEMMGPLASIFGASRTHEEIRGIRDKLISQGYDGIKIVKGGHYMMGEDPNADVWVAFDPKQIKSAIGNRGTWSTKTSNITFMPSDLPEDRQSAVVDLKKQINTINNKLQRYVSDQKNPEALKLSDQKISLWKDIHKLRRGAVRDFGVIGSGPAGLESAASSAYEGLDTVLVDKNVRLGGQPKDSSRIENLYGTPQEGISGPEMTRNAVQKAKANGAEIRAGVGVKSLDYDPETGIKILTYTNGEKERFHNVQISIGNEFKALDIPGAQYADNGNGRMAALHARGGDAIIVGGGNSASQAAIGAVEAGGVKHVYLFARSGVHGMSMSQAEQVAAHPNITIVKDELAAISKKGDGLEVKTKNGDTYNVNGVGTFVGGKPNTEWLPKAIELDDKGKIATKDNGETSIPGVFVAGDARSGSLPRINAASAQGQAVSTEVVKRITEKEKSWNKNNTSQTGTGLTTSQLPSEPNTSGLNKATLGDTRTLDTTTTESSPAKGSAMPSEPTVNIGLNVNDGSKITPEEAISELEKQGVKVTRQSVEQSNTEPTLIASLSRPLTPEEADKVSKSLKQDAIAQFDGSKGELYGPKAEDWKPFNPDYFLNHKSSFMPSDLEDYISKIPVFKHERETSFISDTGDKAVAYRPSNKEQVIDQGPVWNGPNKPTDRFEFKEPSTTEKASFVRSERPLIVIGKDQGNGEMSWNTDVVNKARKEGYDSVVVINDKAIKGKDNLQELIKSNPEKVDWENTLNLVIPLDDSIVSDKSGPNPDRVLDRYNSGELTKDQVSQKLSGNFMPAEEARINQRVPTAKKATEDAVSGNLKVGLDSIKTDPNFANKLSDKVSEYTGFRSGGKDKLDDFVNQGADNLKWLYNQVPDEIKDRSKKWYDGANKIAHDLAAKYHQEPETTAAVLAALSPQNQWHNNVSLAERVLDISQNKTKEKWDEDMTQKMNEIFAGDKYKDIRDDIEGKSFAQLENNYLKAAWLRIYDEAKNPRDYKVVTPEGGRGETMMTGDQPARSMWFSLGPIEKALTVLQNPSRETISEQMGYSHKVRNFYNNIVAPNSKEGDYTSDTHNVAATLIKPLGGTANEVMDNFGKAGKNSFTGDKGTYGLYAEAGRRAAKDLGILPRQLQSVVWEAIRGLFSPEQKRDKNFIASIDKIWKDYENEKITLPEARAKILETSGGIRPPEWSNGMAKDSQPAPDERDISELPVPRRSAKSAPSGNRRPAAAKSSKPLAHSRVDDELRRRGIAPATM